MPALVDFDDGASMRSVKSHVSRGSHRSATKTYKSTRSRKSKAAAVAPPEPSKPPCTPEMIRAGLSQLGRTASGMRCAYLKLQVEGTCMRSAEAVEAFEFLQTLVLRNNELADLAALGSLPCLTHLDVSGNKLADVLQFTLKDGSTSMLRHADFSRNLVSSINNLVGFPRLMSLDLSGNCIERVVGLCHLGMLQRLSLAHNQLKSCKGLSALTKLRELDLSGNVLSSLQPLSSLSALVSLRAAHNHLTSVDGLEALLHLASLDVSCNEIASLHGLVHVADTESLSELMVSGNPLERFMDIRLHMVDLLPMVTVLNGVAVTAKEKVLSANMHGADAEALRQIRRKYFPNGELDDGGGATLPTAAGLVASRAEEEKSGGLDADFARVDAAARALAPGADAPWWRVAEASARVVAAANTAAAAAAAPVSLSAGVLDGLVEGPDGEEGEDADTIGAHAPPVAGTSAAGAAPLLALAEALSSHCGQSHVLLARACWAWVAAHAVPGGRGELWDVSRPLFGSGPHAEAAELALLRAGAADGDEGGDGLGCSGASGAWAERAAWLFVQLARACELKAVTIPGFWKNGCLPPGQRSRAHNHCWSAVKVHGRWRLVDVSEAALSGGAPDATFYVPPEAFLYAYWPLEAQWQLIPEPLSLDAWWGLPECATAFFARGCQLLGGSLRSVNVLPAFKEGEALPSMRIRVAFPSTPGLSMAHATHRADSGALVAEWPARDPSAQPCLAFQQVCHGRDADRVVTFGAKTFATKEHELVVSFPAAGEYIMAVQHVTELPGGMPVHLEGLDAPLRLRVVQSEEVISVKVLVPPPTPHTAEDGILHDPANAVRTLPSASPAFCARRCQLVSPAPGELVEADRTYTFEVVAPGCARAALAAPDSTIVAELEAVVGGGLDPSPPAQQRPGSGGATPGSPRVHSPRPGSAARPGSAGHAPAMARFRAVLAVPRVAELTLVGSTAPEQRCEADALESGDASASAAPASAGPSWERLATLQVIHQAQHIVHVPDEYDVVQVDPDAYGAAQAADMFRQMDLNGDGVVTRQEMLVSFRRNRQLADLLKIPARIAAHDGTLERFFDTYLAIDHNKLGAFTFSEMCAYMGVGPSEDSSEYESGSDYEDDPDLDLSADVFAGGPDAAEVATSGGLPEDPADEAC